jgi:hypothetical protein
VVFFSFENNPNIPIAVFILLWYKDINYRSFFINF